MAVTGRPRLFYNNDGGPLVGGNVPSPRTREQFVYEVVGRFEGTGVDAVAVCMFGGSDVVPIYPTEVPEARRIPLATFESVGEWRQQVNREWIIEHDPWPEAIRAAHEAGMQFWSSMRFNDNHTRRWQSEFRANHPEYVLGDKCPSDHHGEGPEYYFTHAKCRAFNYAIPEVRAHRLKMVGEVCARYDVDGFEWDMTRAYGHHCPTYEGARSILTDYVREARGVLDRVGAKRGRRVGFGVRVHGPVERCYELGTDVATWIREGLLDYVSPSPGGEGVTNPFYKAFVELAGPVGCRVYACTTEHLDGRWKSDGCRSTPAAVERAGALNAWREGVDGIYVMNYQIRFARNRGEDAALLNELGDPAALEFKDKRYLLTACHEAIQNRAYEYQLPLAVGVTPDGPGQAVHFTVSDDLAKGARLGIVEAVSLELAVGEPCGEVVDFYLNGALLPRAPLLAYQRAWLGVGGLKLVYDLREGDLVRRGENEFRVAVRRRNEKILDRFTVYDLGLEIRYRALPMRARY